MIEIDTIDKFEEWFLSIPDADKTLLNKNKDGHYSDPSIELLKSAYVAGLKSSMSDCLSVISKYKGKV